MPRPRVDPRKPASSAIPEWFPIAGYIAGMLTLFFFMYLALFGDGKANFASIVVLAMGAALSFSFIGGKAAAEGRVPLAKESPLTFTVAGGVGVFVITLIVAWFAFYERSALATEPTDVATNVAKETTKEATGPEAFTWTSEGPVTFETAVAQLEKARNVTVAYAPACPRDFPLTLVSGGTHEGSTPQEYLEKLQDRLLVRNVGYTVDPTGQGRRFEIVCQAR